MPALQLYKTQRMAHLAWIENRGVSSWSASQKLKSSMPMWHWGKHHLYLKQNKNCWRTCYAGEYMVYVILPRSLMHRLFYCWTAATKVKAAQGLHLLTQLLKDLKEIRRKTSVQHDSLYSSSTDFSFPLQDMHRVWYCPWLVSMNVPSYPGGKWKSPIMLLFHLN